MLYMVNSKKGVSVMIGYILLVSFAVMIGVIVFQWMNTYVPRQTLECPSETSLFIKNYNYNCINQTLDITLTNNGKFNIAGYYIYASNSTEQTLAAKDISNYTTGAHIGNLIKFTGTENSFKPGEEETNGFNLSTSNFGILYSIEITPLRWEEEENKKIPITCTNAKVKEILYCSG